MEPKSIFECDSSPVNDKELRNKLRAIVKFPNVKGGYETSLQKYNGIPVYQWYRRTMASVRWFPFGDPIYYEDIKP